MCTVSSMSTKISLKGLYSIKTVLYTSTAKKIKQNLHQRLTFFPNAGNTSIKFPRVLAWINSCPTHSSLASHSHFWVRGHVCPAPPFGLPRLQVSVIHLSIGQLLRQTCSTKLEVLQLSWYSFTFTHETYLDFHCKRNKYMSRLTRMI